MKVGAQLPGLNPRTSPVERIPRVKTVNACSFSSTIATEMGTQGSYLQIAVLCSPTSWHPQQYCSGPID